MASGSALRETFTAAQSGVVTSAVAFTDVASFKLAPNSKGGWKGTVLHTFVDRPGAAPVGVILDATGNLYGAAAGDGNVRTFGALFEITP